MSALPAWIERDNDESLAALVEQLRAAPGSVIPFVGAGMSQAFGFPGWAEFLRDSADGAPEILEDVEARRYEKAAQKLKDRGADRFHFRIHHVFGREPDRARLTRGPLSLLASMTSGPVITSNFDHVLESVFDAAENPFEEVIAGVQLDSIVRAIQAGQHALIKIHGDARERSSRTFTLLEYEERYERDEDDANRRITVPDLAWVLFTNRPLLFLGSALDGDRIVDVLKEIHARLLGVRHYAIAPAPNAEAAARERRETLDACGVSPIWFPEGRFDCIEEYLRQLRQEATSREVVPRSRDWRSDQRPSDDGAAWFADATSADGRTSGGFPAVVDRVARGLLGGRIAFVVATEESLFTLIKRLSKDTFGIREEDMALSNLPKILVQFGRAAILDAVKVAVAETREQRQMTGRFVASLPAYMRSTGRTEKASQLVFTTDYGTMLEEELDAAGERFDLLYYVSAGADEGAFLHRAPDGSIRVVERPEHLPRSSAETSVIVKLRGGALYADDLADHAYPESLAIEASDAARLAGRLLPALPQSVRTELRRRSLLLLGQGLISQPDIDTLVRYTGTGREPESWAFGSRGDEAYWRRYGLQLREEAGETLLTALRVRMRELTGEKPPRRELSAGDTPATQLAASGPSSVTRSD